MKIGDNFPCLCCLHPNANEMRADKHGKPYSKCWACGAICFYRGLQSLRGPTALWGPLQMALSQGDVEAGRVLVQQAIQASGQTPVRVQ